MASRAVNAREASTRSSSLVLPFSCLSPADRKLADTTPGLKCNPSQIAFGVGWASRYFFGQGTLMLTVEVSPLKYLSSVFAGKPPFGHFFGTVP